MRLPPGPVRCVCGNCGEEWDDTIIYDPWGTDYHERHDECPSCGNGDPSCWETGAEYPLDELDIAERKGWI